MYWSKSYYLSDIPELAPEGQDDKFYSSRQALRLALQLATGNLPDWEQVKLENFQFLSHFPRYQASISHSGKASVAAVMDKNFYLGIGVDLELEGRSVDDRSRRHFVNVEDDQRASSLELWCMKEASFKALSPLRENFKLPKNNSGNIYLKDICIKLENKENFSFYPLFAPEFLGQGTLKEEKLGGQTYLLALALLRKKTSY